jgi:hypothetical protein
MRLAKKAIRGIPAGHHWHNTAWYTKFSFDGGVHYSAFAVVSYVSAIMKVKGTTVTRARASSAGYEEIP